MRSVLEFDELLRAYLRQPLTQLYVLGPRGAGLQFEIESGRWERMIFGALIVS
jgi:hypothetical protein